ncbi:MAG: GTPase Era [Bacteriovoracaceae bacterium]|jgi:GTP-binding protein Era|nr:GTPase Era [Bacteriovoracaceae bacterium]
MLITDQHPHNKSIMVSLLGKPNAGKSTLANHLLGFDLSIVSSKPQTTRNTFHCVLTIDRTEIILVDTPGVHSSGQELNVRMNGQAEYGSEGTDLNLLLVDANKDTLEEVKEFSKEFEHKLDKTWVIFTKTDRVKEDRDFEAEFSEIQKIIPNAERFFNISAKSGDNVHLLIGDICDEAEEGPHLYPNGNVSNKNERFFATEYIREQAFKVLKDEIPYEVAVVIEDYQDAFEKDEKKLDTRISASILVNRPSQRGIVVGKKGAIIKQIGTEARKKIEAMVGSRVHLNLHVKVSPKWFKNNFVLEEIGLPRVQKSKRVWRSRND